MIYALQVTWAPLFLQFIELILAFKDGQLDLYVILKHHCLRSLPTDFIVLFRAFDVFKAYADKAPLYEKNRFVQLVVMVTVSNNFIS